MSSTFLIEWRFSPPDYFEESGKTTIDNYELHFEEGYIKVEVLESDYEKVKSIRDELSKAINDRFLGAQLISHQPYELTKASITGIKPDGGRLLFGEIHFQSKLEGKKIDFQLRKKDGTIIDTRKERIERKSRLAELVAKFRDIDKVADSIIKSYHNAVEDPDNELVHLYEIRDALVIKFGNEKKARDSIGVSKKLFKRLRRLSCSLPLAQGRHRGENFDYIRPATNGELTEARTIAREMIEGYLQYLDDQQ